jgi:hypothetical protein
VLRGLGDPGDVGEATGLLAQHPRRLQRQRRPPGDVLEVGDVGRP